MDSAHYIVEIREHVDNTMVAIKNVFIASKSDIELTDSKQELLLDIVVLTLNRAIKTDVGHSVMRTGEVNIAKLERVIEGLHPVFVGGIKTRCSFIYKLELEVRWHNRLWHLVVVNEIIAELSGRNSQENSCQDPFHI